jgi:hypothetical protein
MSESQLKPGPGTRIVQTPMGDLLGAPTRTGNFKHPFRAALANGVLQFSKGIVFGSIPHEPTINKVPISGDANNPAPSLRLDPSVFNGQGWNDATWACIEITPNADGSTDKKTMVEVVHRGEPTSANPKVGRQPLCMILWAANRPARILDIVYFNLRYYRTTPAPGHGIPRHFFF